MLHWHWYKIQSHQFGNPFFGTLVRPFHFRQWLHVYAVKIGTSYFGNLFPACQQELDHARGSRMPYGIPWGWSQWPITSSTHVGPVRICCVMTGMVDTKWEGCASVPKYREFFKWTLKNICEFLSLIKMHELLMCNIIKMMPYNSCSQMLRISLKTNFFYRPPLWPAVHCWPWGVISSWLRVSVYQVP